MKNNNCPIDLEERKEGVAFGVKAQPGAKKNEIAGVFDRSLKVKVTDVAEKGKANKAIISLLSKKLGIAKSLLEIVAGDTNSRKKILVRDMNSDTLIKLIQDCF